MRIHAYYVQLLAMSFSSSSADHAAAAQARQNQLIQIQGHLCLLASTLVAFIAWRLRSKWRHLSWLVGVIITKLKARFGDFSGQVTKQLHALACRVYEQL